MKRLSSKLGLVGEDQFFFMCPGCGELNCISRHLWNGNSEKPSFSPSIRVTHGSEDLFVCHSFIRDGQIEFLTDCTHALRGQTVELPDLPEYCFS